MPRIRKSAPAMKEVYQGHHKFEHWYVDNQVYFITARCSGHFPAFAREQAKQIFWDRFSHYTSTHGFTPFVTSLLGNHYHTRDYLRKGDELGEVMRKLHGSVAKLVNDGLPTRLVPFWRRGRATLVRDWRDYSHTRVNIELERAVGRAKELKAFLEGVPYKRYDHRGQGI